MGCLWIIVLPHAVHVSSELVSFTCTSALEPHNKRKRTPLPGRQRDTLRAQYGNARTGAFQSGQAAVVYSAKCACAFRPPFGPTSSRMFGNGAHLPPIAAAPSKTARLQNYHSNLEEYLRKLSYQLEALINEQTGLESLRPQTVLWCFVLATVKAQKAVQASNAKSRAKLQLEKDKLQKQADEQTETNDEFRRKLKELDRRALAVDNDARKYDSTWKEQQRAEKQTRLKVDEKAAQITAALGVHDVPSQEARDIKVTKSAVDRATAQVSKLEKDKRTQDEYLVKLQTEITKAEKQHDELEENIAKFSKRSEQSTGYTNLKRRMDVLEKEKFLEEDNWKKMMDTFEDRGFTVPGEVYDLEHAADRKLQADINAKKNLLERQKDYILLLEDWISTTQHDINETEALTLVAKDSLKEDIPMSGRTEDGEEKDPLKVLAQKNKEKVEREMFKVGIDMESKRAAIKRYRSLLEALQTNRRLLQRSRSAEYPKPERSKPVEKKKAELLELYRKEAAITSRQERLSITAEDLRDRLAKAKERTDIAQQGLKKILDVKEARFANPQYGRLEHDPNEEEVVRLDNEVAQLRAQIADRANERTRFHEELVRIRDRTNQWKTTANDFTKLQKKIVAKHKLKSEIRTMKTDYSNLQKQIRAAQKDLELSVLRRECIVDKAHAAVLAKNSIVRSQQVEENDKLQKSIDSIRKDLQLARNLRR
uniref:TPR_MLP1_2 domain-containing protein n=1 Tax=Steinernema glaseri TaxID=37863 RepID=A0A1I7Y0D4_9BILA